MSPKRRTKQLLILLLGGFVLAFGGCLLFASQIEVNDNSSQGWSIVGAIIFLVGAGMFAIGGIAAFVIVMMKLFGSNKPAPPAETPQPPATPPAAPPSQS